MIFGLFDQLFPLMFTVIFLIIIGTFIYTAVTGLTTWHKNNQSPRLTVSAKVVAKRQNTTHHSHPVAGELKSDVPALALALKDARTPPAARHWPVSPLRMRCLL